MSCIVCSLRQRERTHWEYSVSSRISVAVSLLSCHSAATTPVTTNPTSSLIAWKRRQRACKAWVDSKRTVTLLGFIQSHTVWPFAAQSTKASLQMLQTAQALDARESSNACAFWCWDWGQNHQLPLLSARISSCQMCLGDSSGFFACLMRAWGIGHWSGAAYSSYHTTEHYQSTTLFCEPMRIARSVRFQRCSAPFIANLGTSFCFITYHSLSEGAQSYCAVDGSDLCSSHEPQELCPNSTFALPLYSVATFWRAQPEMMYRLFLELNWCSLLRCFICCRFWEQKWPYCQY